MFNNNYIGILKGKSTRWATINELQIGCLCVCVCTFCWVKLKDGGEIGWVLEQLTVLKQTRGWNMSIAWNRRKWNAPKSGKTKKQTKFGTRKRKCDVLVGYWATDVFDLGRFRFVFKKTVKEKAGNNSLSSISTPPPPWFSGLSVVVVRPSSHLLSIYTRTVKNNQTRKEIRKKKRSCCCCCCVRQSYRGGVSKHLLPRLLSLSLCIRLHTCAQRSRR